VSVDPFLAQEAKAIVSLAFRRNGLLEGIHAGVPCPTCAGDDSISHISDAQMKALIKFAVDRVYTVLCLRDTDVSVYERLIKAENSLCTHKWDEPEISTFS
jgi:hypothetical protein